MNSSRFTFRKPMATVTALPLIALLATLLSSAGCNVLGVAGQALNTDTSTAVYTLPKRPTIVIAEKYSNPSESAMDDEPLARFLTEDLRQRDIAPLTDSDRVYVLRRSMPPAKWHAMTIDSVGRQVEADQVLYVNLVSVSVSLAPGSGMMKGQAEALVRLVDTKTGRTIWPTDAAEGWPVGVETPMLRTEGDNVTETSVRTTVLRALADHIAKLFYTYNRS